MDAFGNLDYPELIGWPVSRLLALVAEASREEAEVIGRVLAMTRGAEHARAAIEAALAGAEPAWLTAARLAFAQPREVLLGLLAEAVADEANAELYACLLQEMVTRGIDPGEVGEDLRHELNHPLAALPLRLDSSERDFDLQDYDIRGGGSYSADYFLTKAEEKAVLTAGSPQVATRITASGQRERMTSAVRGWLERSNGRAEAEVFEFAYPIGDIFGASTLAGLPLESLRGLEPDGLVFRTATFDEVVTTLFCAAANGGSYSSARGGAYGRAALWESVAALAGADPDEPVEEVAALAGRLRWWRFQAVTPWFEQDIPEFGFAALRVDERTLAVLAATDTD
ncbi:hypothetical protein SAMN05421504_10520 [Amycolatopsis xylanica]|uniref:Uncharacterized protein n=1 Tax=Amycolatopsis xylanica TaxID=589385 RepID=A0A1H3IL25_9PSEU|nr:hypothetical protein SAMN05421504_10520 [Amycolatopsis xylanica]